MTTLKITEIEGIGPSYGEKLESAGMKNSDDLLDAGKTPQGRKDLAEKTGISSKLILEWINLCDLIRIKGVGEEYSDLLEEAGVDTVVELGTRNAENLQKKMEEVNKAKNLVRKTPTIDQVTAWVDEAKTLPRVIEY
ncbi:MAG: DUF4332 domain-containing protein [Nitrosopumilus sp.]|nr:DUF4332 domain-containing protein [Nitrosopumilus sp.]MDH3824758.1 DUF4332 domain-containing protein [Nitrosopumilus sp.]